MYRIGQEEIEAVARAILSRDFFKINGAGHEVLEFDKEWAQTVGSDYALTMTSGFAALTSALIGLGVGPGDEVIVPGYTYIALDGVENCISALRDIESGKIHKCFIEMSACVGSCIGGPVMEKYHSVSPIKDFITVTGYAGERDFNVEQPEPMEIKKHFSAIEHRLMRPSESEILTVLRQMGKFKPSDELNCGSCGYNSCREKAIAIIQGKAEISMCLPFLKDKAESFSDTIVENTPNGLIVLNENLEVQQINNAARRIMNIRFTRDRNRY